MPRLDWISQHDPRSLNYPIRPLLAARAKRSKVLWRHGGVLDQGAEGACVGFAWTGEALASPVRVNLAMTEWNGSATDMARDVYHGAQRVDEWEGEGYDGTSVLAGAKVMQQRGFIIGYRWCFTTADVAQAVLQQGPVVLGIPWLDGMWSPNGFGELIPSGGIAGGHAILCDGYDPEKKLGNSPQKMFHLTNSWGAGWGVDGGAWIRGAALEYLLGQEGEACVPMGRSYSRSGTGRAASVGLR